MSNFEHVLSKNFLLRTSKPKDSPTSRKAFESYGIPRKVKEMLRWCRLFIERKLLNEIFVDAD